MFHTSATLNPPRIFRLASGDELSPANHQPSDRKTGFPITRGTALCPLPVRREDSSPVVPVEPVADENRPFGACGLVVVNAPSHIFNAPHGGPRAFSVQIEMDRCCRRYAWCWVIVLLVAIGRIDGSATAVDEETITERFEIGASEQESEQTVIATTAQSEPLGSKCRSNEQENNFSDDSNDCLQEGFEEIVSDHTVTDEDQLITSTVPSTTVVESTTAARTTTEPPPPSTTETRGRMVRFGTRRRGAVTRVTPTSEPKKRPTTTYASVRTVQSRRGLFNPELRNRYLGRFRSTTTVTPDSS